MNTPDNLRYSKSHEWIRIDGETVTIGVTEHAQEQLGDIVYVELPKVGEDVAREGTFGVLESVKAVSDCYSPISGKIIQVNDSLVDAPQTINEDCYGEGWIVRLEPSNPSELEALLDCAAYTKFVDEESA